MPTQSKSRTTHPLPTGFDVVCTIGRVEYDATGTHTPTEAAYLLIARADIDGHFTFPNVNGDTCHVTVETQSPKGESDTSGGDTQW